MACPSCGQIVMASATTCRFCGLPIDARTAAAAQAAQQRLNTAIIHANAMKYSALVAVLNILVLVFVASGFLGDRRATLAWLGPPLALAGTAWWFHQHGRLESADPDYAAARVDVKRTAYIWAGALAVEVPLLVWFVAAG
jgi:hypothetical protein